LRFANLWGCPRNKIGQKHQTYSTPRTGLQAISHAKKKKNTLKNTKIFFIFGERQTIIYRFPLFTEVWLPNPSKK